jgi:hypothetical protein
MRKDNKSIISGYAKHPPLPHAQESMQESTQDNKQDATCLIYPQWMLCHDKLQNILKT